MCLKGTQHAVPPRPSSDLATRVVGPGIDTSADVWQSFARILPAGNALLSGGRPTGVAKQLGGDDVRVGFIGLGAMGQEIVPRLLAGGHQVVGWNRSEEHTSELQSLMRSSYDVFCLK